MNNSRFFIGILFVFAFQILFALPLAEQFRQVGYLEICNEEQGTETFDSLYACFDEFIEFLQINPIWAQKLYIAKERFIRSKERNFYSTNFFGFYDESIRKGRNQIAFYYSTHFHEFISSQYREFNQIPQMKRFFEACSEVQKPCENLFNEAVDELGLKTIFDSTYGKPPILFKVIKYFPSYVATRPHYDGTALSLLLDSTDHQSLLLSAYQPSYNVDDFSSPQRKYSRSQKQTSILLIPGAFLAEFAIYPTPHIVALNGIIRYAAVAFAMRADYTSPKIDFSPLPDFLIE